MREECAFLVLGQCLTACRKPVTRSKSWTSVDLQGKKCETSAIRHFPARELSLTTILRQNWKSVSFLQGTTTSHYGKRTNTLFEWVRLFTVRNLCIWRKSILPFEPGSMNQPQSRYSFNLKIVPTFVSSVAPFHVLFCERFKKSSCLHQLFHALWSKVSRKIF